MVKLLLSLGLLVAACVTTGSTEEAALPKGGQVDGRALYERSCQRCHSLYMPTSFSARDWKFFVRKYGRKARLSQLERVTVLEYLEQNALPG